MNSNLEGKSIGRYHILEQLGEGGMAEVYKAFDTRLERQVAIKFIRKDAFPPSALERILKRFEREAKALAQLDHPNIVKVHDYGDFNGTPYIVMQYVRGGTLKSRMGKQFSASESIALIRPIARALQYAHGKGILHRDVKPSNILIGEGNEPVLTDFGIAKILDYDEGQTLTGTGVGVGTPEYMAPEQGMGKPVDGRADQYALGVILYELLTGTKPYSADTPLAILLKQVNDPLPRPVWQGRPVDPGLEQILIKSLSKDPDNRYASMFEFEKALWLLEKVSEEKEQVMVYPLPPDTPQPSGKKTYAETEDELQPANPKKSKIPWMVISALLGLILIACLFVGIWYLKNKAVTPIPSVVTVPGNQSGNTQTETETGSEANVTGASQQAENIESAAPTQIIVAGTQRVREIDNKTEVFIPAGEFQMGSLMEDDEMPVRTVYVDDYWIDEVEVTNYQYELCVTSGPCTIPSETRSFTRDKYFGIPSFKDFPVIYVDWQQAQTYCEWVGGSLPTEAQWEKAARGDDNRVYPWGNNFNCKYGNFDDETKFDKATVPGGKGCDGYPDTSIVGVYPNGASPYGVLDMAGNVWEWTMDWYGPYDPRDTQNPTGLSYGDLKVIRGGSFGSLNLDYMRVSYRFRTPPTDSKFFLGFRCVREP